jgi:hypothetical protein
MEMIDGLISSGFEVVRPQNSGPNSPQDWSFTPVLFVIARSRQTNGLLLQLAGFKDSRRVASSFLD